MHGAMLAAIFKAVRENTVPESCVGIYSTGTKDKMGCDIPRFIEFRSLFCQSCGPDTRSPAMSSCQIRLAHGASPSMTTTCHTSRLLGVMPSLPPRLLRQALK